MLKPSRYNHLVELERARLGFQGRTGAVALFDEEHWTVLASAGTVPVAEDHPAAGALREGGFLVDAGTDELLELRRLYLRSNYGGPEANLVLAPTLECNMACSYCFEAGRRSGRMSRETAEAVPGLAGRLLERARALRVTWYGGEPLLALDLIRELSGSLRAEAEKRSAAYEARVVTNGTLLTVPVAEELRSLGVRRAQITLDGGRERHDRRRPLKGGGGTWRHIVANIAAAAGVLGVAIRVTVGPGDAADLVPLCRELDRLEVPPEVGVFPAPLNEGRACGSTDCRVGGTFIADLIQAGLWDQDRGHPRLVLPSPDPAPGCLASSDLAVAVDQRGDLHRCLETVGDRAWSVGNVAAPGSSPPNDARWLQADPFVEDGPCLDCGYLPQCFGGCLRGYLAEGRRVCTPFKDLIGEWVKAVAGGSEGGEQDEVHSSPG